MTLRKLKIIVSTTNYCFYHVLNQFGKQLYYGCWQRMPRAYKDLEVMHAVPRKLDGRNVSVTFWKVVVEEN